MYTPHAFVVSNLDQLDALLARDAFITLVTVDAQGLPTASHLPVLYRRDGDRILLEGHWARANPQAAHAGPALVIVHGPHAYISPGWYPDKLEMARVPTWNYAVAHLHGSLQATDDADRLAGIVAGLSEVNEARVGGDWRFDSEDPAYARQLRGIIGFRFEVERVEMKFKLGQNHPPANRMAAAAALCELPSPRDHEVAALMRTTLPPPPSE